MGEPHHELPRGAQVFVDETKAGEYVLVATWVPSAQVAEYRRRLRGLVPSGAVRVHFRKLTHTQRLRVLAELRELGVCVTVERSPAGDEASAREETMTELLGRVARLRAVRVVVELHEPVRTVDLAVARRMGGDHELVHLRAAEEPLLWISDAAAWCVQRGGCAGPGMEQARLGVLGDDFRACSIHGSAGAARRGSHPQDPFNGSRIPRLRVDMTKTRRLRSRRP